MTAALGGPARVGLPWQSLTAFLRIASNPCIQHAPLSPRAAWEQVTDWLAAPAAWVPVPGRAHADVLGWLIVPAHVTGKLVPDAHLAALAIEHGVPVASSDSDFALFPGLTWVNPLTA